MLRKSRSDRVKPEQPYILIGRKMMDKQIVPRRRFLSLLGLSGAGLFSGASLSNSSVFAQEGSAQPLIDSPPVLQCPTENSIAVAWAVGQRALGSVEFGTDKTKLDQTASGEVIGLKALHERYLQVRLEGLKPNTRYYYRTVTAPFIFHHGHKLEQQESVASDVFSFETPGLNSATGSFSVINDTHNNQPTLQRLTSKLAEIKSDYTIWNGDLVGSYDNPDMAVEAILRPGGSAFATERPMLFVPGNHDHRGEWARNLSLAVPTWDHPAPEDRHLPRNFVVRKGPLALIGLDTGEDKPDWHPAWAGHVRFEPYRIAQRDWLERILKSPAVATAPFVVAFCHIPIFDPDPNANGGDILDRWAQFQRQAGNLWGPLLTKHGVQLLIAGHRHRFRHDAPTADRTWTQIVGGGHEPNGQITIIHGKVSGDTMEVIVDELNSGTEFGRWKFPKRTT
jgi:predicted phosphodiesterase